MNAGEGDNLALAGKRRQMFTVLYIQERIFRILQLGSWAFCLTADLMAVRSSTSDLGYVAAYVTINPSMTDCSPHVRQKGGSSYRMTADQLTNLTGRCSCRKIGEAESSFREGIVFDPMRHGQ